MKKTKKLKGFTLVEVLLALLLAGLMASVALPKYASIQSKAKEHLNKSIGHTLQTSIESYNLTEGSYPPQSEKIEQLLALLVEKKVMASTPTNPFTGTAYADKDSNGKISYTYDSTEDAYTLSIYGKKNEIVLLTLSN